MARTQVLTAFTSLTVVAPATPEALSASENFVKSFAIQGLPTNTDFVFIGDAFLQEYAIAPGKSVTITGDNMDNGTAGKIDLASVYVRVLVAGEGVAFLALEGI
jgi:hypothetical protein